MPVRFEIHFAGEGETTADCELRIRRRWKRIQLAHDPRVLSISNRRVAVECPQPDDSLRLLRDLEAVVLRLQERLGRTLGSSGGGWCQHPKKCALGPLGSPGAAGESGYCRVHAKRLRERGNLGPPGPYSVLRRTKITAKFRRDLDAAEAFLEFVVPRTGRGVVTRRRQRGFVLWQDGSRSEASTGRLRGFRLRGWIDLGALGHEGRPSDQAIAVVQGARARAEAIIADRDARAARRVRSSQQSGSDPRGTDVQHDDQPARAHALQG